MEHETTICEPHAAAGILPPDPQFGGCRQMPVSLPEQDDDGNFELGLSFGDYQRMHTDRYAASRKNGVPAWALNDRDTQRVLLAFLERRVFGKRQLAKLPRLRSPRKRLARVLERIQQQRERRIEVIKALMLRERDARLRGEDTSKLIVQFRNLDFRLWLEGRNLPATVATVMHCFYRLHWTTADIAREFGLTDDFARQVLHRLNKTAKSLGLM
jgi:hypothetical protein